MQNATPLTITQFLCVHRGNLIEVEANVGGDGRDVEEDVPKFEGDVLTLLARQRRDGVFAVGWQVVVHRAAS